MIPKHTITEHSFNPTLSKEVYMKCKTNIEPKNCYINIFHTIKFYAEKFRTGEWRIAYGYIRVLAGYNLMTRHCFIVNRQGEAIDPTLQSLTHFDEKENRNHTSFAIFNSINDYFLALETNKNTPDMITLFKKEEQKVIQPWIEKNHFLII